MLDAQPASGTLADWLVSHWKSAEYKRLTEAWQQRPHLSPPAEIAMLYSLVRHMKPDRVLEIGTYFGQTTIALAEAIVENGIGHLDTVDPFGGDRIPDIMAKWPEAERNATTFQPIYSMHYFSELEHHHGLLGLAFVDGNHKFDYALYDLLSAADRLQPNGAIVVDNLELEGVYLATKQFLRFYSGWTIFFEGQILTAEQAQNGITREMVDRGGTWAVLLPPPSFYVSGRGYHCFKPTPQHPTILGLHLNVVDVSRPLPVLARFIHIARGTDSHITGEQHLHDVRRMSKDISPGRTVVKYDFDRPMNLTLTHNADHFHFDYVLEIALPEVGDYLLLDPEKPFEVIYG